MFIDRIMSIGLGIAALATVLAAAALILMVIYLLNLPVPQVVRLVSLVPSPGTIVLDDVGDSATLSLQGYYSDQTLAELAEDFITYESTNPRVVSVSSDGVVTANGSGGAEIVIGFGGFSKTMHALVFGDTPTLPPIDPAMVGAIPGLDEEVRATLNRIIVELHPGYHAEVAGDVASDLEGEVIFSYQTFPGYVIEFDTRERTLLNVLSQLGGDVRVDTAYPDILLETDEHPIDTLLIPPVTGFGDRRECSDFSGTRKMRIGEPADAYLQAGYERAWRMIERAPLLNTVVVSTVEFSGLVNVAGMGQHQVISEEFDSKRIYALPLTGTPAASGEHAVKVTSVLAAKNSQYDNPEQNDRNFSGIITSVDNLEYGIISIDYGDTWSGVMNALEQLQTVKGFGQAIDVVNLSFSFPNVPVHANKGRAVKLMEAMSEVSFVSSAGNQRKSADQRLPAALSMERGNVITTGGADCEYEGRWVGSNFGDAVTIAAPGEQILAVNISDPSGYGLVNGTSYAAPMVTGGVALLKAIDPDATPEEVKKLLAETGDRKEICTSTSTVADTCPQKNKEWWSFLRADKAVAKLLSERIGADVDDVGRYITVPTDTQRVVGHRFEFEVDIENTGELAWPLYGEAIVRAPNGSVSSLSAENVVAPGSSHPFRWGFWPAANASGCWDMRVRVWAEPPLSGKVRDALRDWRKDANRTDEINDIDDLLNRLKDADLLKDSVETRDVGYMRAALAELTGALDRGVEIEDIGLLADTAQAGSEWIEDVLEVRADPSQPEQCSGSDKTIPFSTGQVQAGAKANILLLADTSGSMEGPKAEALREAVGIFAQRMSDIRLHTKGGIDPDPDRVGLTDFDNDYREVIPIGPIDPAQPGLDTWEGAANSLDADGGTALYDAIIRSIDTLEELGTPARNNILIALTDGIDQDSSSTLADALDRLKQSSVTLFALALSEPGGSGEYDFEVLQELANATRGAAYAADTENLSGLYELFSTLFEIEP